ncbi:MAG: hypothetical protein JWQ90_5547 [Hydrocarboniphaga sp.]|uniref:PAS domain-containing protein n=1 Tax=Hydrocarboniphaga sp. TaxID=2033016 RepID=UPI00261FDB7E|nr:PAS domain-containing protein [Hydrocarboniphaga sp.]MDB5973097.1 hypothetical protein [Hydrocarboniphaga sp.]
MEVDGERLYCTLGRDVTAQKNEEQRQRLQATVFESSHTGIALSDAAGMIVDVNAAYLKMSGRTRQQSIGVHHRVFRTESGGRAIWQQKWDDSRTAWTAASR